MSAHNSDSETKLFSNKEALDPDFVPKLLPFRETHQRAISEHISTFFLEKGTRHIYCHGKTGTGKTHAVSRVLEDLLEVEGYSSIKVNCWGKTSKDILMQIAKRFSPMLGKVSLNEAVEKLKNNAKRKVIFLDDADMAKDTDYLYIILNSPLPFMLILTTAGKDYLATLDNRIRSRFMPIEIEFVKYSEKEVLEILRERKKYSFFENTWETRALDKLANSTFEKNDLRFGLMVMSLAGQSTENNGKEKVTLEEIENAIKSI